MDRGGIGDEGGDFPSESSKRSAGKEGAFAGGRGSIVTARGTGDGLILRLDSRAAEFELLEALTRFVESRQSFLAGNEISLEWIGGDPLPSLQAAVQSQLSEAFNVAVKADADASRSANEGGRVMRLVDRVESTQSRQSGAGLGLFGGIEGLDMADGLAEEGVVSELVESEASAAIDISAWDDPDARLVYRTLRSGQKIETEHSLVVIGDVNSGAELVAGGDIIVLGSLRGVAHAGAYDETGGGRFIVAMDLQPTQLRIGSIISRGSGEGRSDIMEIARVDGNLIVVERYNQRAISGFKR